MRTSAAGLELIKTFEGLRDTAVRLPDGRWMIGYGHVRTARDGLTISAADAHDLLVHDLRPIESVIGAIIFAPLTQGQFDALASLAYNISLGQFRDCDIVRSINAGDYLAAANGFDLWRRARLNGRVVVVDALVRRRAAEKMLFLEHPSGQPSAPTPIVPPEIDFGEDAGLRRSAPAQSIAEDSGPTESHSPAAPAANDIVDAVRRLAERTQQAIAPVRELSLPPGAIVAPPEPPPSPEQLPKPDPAVSEELATSLDPREAKPMSAEELARASLTVAERVSRILNGVQKRIDTAESAERQDGSSVREGLPDFDHPGERGQSEAQVGARRLIDDTEVVELDRDPALAFAEAERKAKLVNGQSRRMGPISGRVLVLAPWIIVLALSILGFVIGAVDAFRGGGSPTGIPRLAGTILAVFGVMTVMSLYYIFWKRSTDEV